MLGVHPISNAFDSMVRRPSWAIPDARRVGRVTRGHCIQHEDRTLGRKFHLDVLPHLVLNCLRSLVRKLMSDSVQVALGEILVMPILPLVLRVGTCGVALWRGHLLVEVILGVHVFDWIGIACLAITPIWEISTSHHTNFPEPK